MKLSVHCFNLLSLVQFTCLFLCQTSCKANQSDDIASGSGDFPLVPTPTVVDPTSTAPNLLVPFSTDVDAPPPSASLYIVPIPHSTSLSEPDALPTRVLGISTTTSILSPSSSVVPVPPTISSLPLVSYTINLARTVVLNQLRVVSIIGNITLSLTGLLALEPSDIFDVKLLTNPGMKSMNKRQSPSGGELVTFSAIDFSVRESHVSSVELLNRKVSHYNIYSVASQPTLYHIQSWLASYTGI